MSSISALRALGLAVGMLVTSASQAGNLSVTLPEYNGNGVTGATETVGTFTFSVPTGQTVIGATISGFFGNSVAASTAAADIYADGIKVATCVYQAACWKNQTAPLAWSYTFAATDLGIFADGNVVLTALQSKGVAIRLGETTLSLVTQALPAVPEPSTYALMLGGLAAMAWVSRRRA